mgnify:CR=1 FL=1
MTTLKSSVAPHQYFFKILTFLLLALIATRLIFLGSNYSYFADQSAASFAYALFHGLRFDAAVLSILNAPLLLALIFLGGWRRLQRGLIGGIILYVMLIDLPAVLLNLVDTVYFPYTGRRSGPEILSMLRDVSTQIPQLLSQYWPFVLLGLGFCVAVVFVLQRARANLGPKSVTWYVYLLLSMVLVLVFVIVGRGGLQGKPLRALHAYSWPSSDLGAVVLNTPFMLLRQKANEVKKLDYFDSDKQALESLAKPPVQTQSAPTAKPQNVLIIILESYGLEYFGPPYGDKSYAPFIESLAAQGRFFPNGIANGRRSIEAVPSILAGMPSLMSEAFMRSSFQANKVYGIGEIVKPYAYQTAFFHGAKNGSMYFDETTQRFGFDHYYGRDEYANDNDFDGQWGIFDEPFLQFVATKLDAIETPFLSSVFTISSHPPYTLPEKYLNQIPEGNIPMHRVVQYTDIALKAFFNTASTMDWFNDTLFIITADHTSDNFDTRFASPLGRHQIPLILYHPAGGVKQGIDTSIAQQVDIPATIVDFLGLPETAKLLPFGRSLLQAGMGEALLKEDGEFWLLSNNGFVKTQTDTQNPHFAGILPKSFTTKLDENTLEESRTDVSPQVLESRLNAYLQLYFNGLISNQHYFDE